ncbi:HD domain-containing phosphohydrolase [Vibrio maritimus]|uniref:HD domain-containing phosphohydrolase n=1 Tax=Vibrio maritimus TaxID=990268 RepID=UPI00406967CF
MDNKKRSIRKLSIRRVVALLITLAITIMALISAAVIYSLTKEREIESTLETYQLVSSVVSNRLEQFDRVGQQAAYQLGYLLNSTPKGKTPAELIDLFGAAFVGNEFLHSIYIGYDNDDFLQLFNVKPDYIAKQLSLLDDEAWMVVAHVTVDGERLKRTRYFLSDLTMSRETVEVSHYYPTQRNWYSQAQTNANTVHKTAPYLFHNLRVPGQTYSIRLPDRGAVIGVDISLASLGGRFENSLEQIDLLQESNVYVVESNGKMIAASSYDSKSRGLPQVTAMPLTDEEITLVVDSPPLQLSNQSDWEPLDFTIAGEPYGLTADLFTLISDATGLQFQFVNGRTWEELVEDYRLGKIDILQSVAEGSDLANEQLEGDTLYTVDYALATRSDEAKISSLDNLGERYIGAIAGWSIMDAIQEAYPDLTIYYYDSYEEAFKDLTSQRISAVLDIAEVLQTKVDRLKHESISLQVLEPHRLLPYRFTYLANKDLEPYVALINKSLTHLEKTGVVARLKAKWFETSSESYGHFVNQAILDKLSQPKHFGTISQATIEGIPHFIYLDKVSSEPNEYLIISIPTQNILEKAYHYVAVNVMWILGTLFIMLPIAWFASAPLSTPIKRLVIETKKIKHRRYNKVTIHKSSISELNELSTSIYDMAQSLEQFQRSQDEFIESIIQLVAKTIDDKSPYTGAHCLRVPELALMLVQAAEQDKSKAFRAFRFENEDQRREFRIAAWLHDCGKITTPEYVVDKGTKLETNYNRINEVRMRFEVLWRDAEIEVLKQQLNEPENIEPLMAQLDVRKKELMAQFDFVAKTNVGGEFLSDEDKQKLSSIGGQTWVRHFDDRLGLSPVEELRMPKERATLPATETLLSDKVQHVIKRTTEVTFPPELGIKVDIPEHQYNLGELHNLSISRGTLTPEERYKINEHMITGIKMLNSIPFPDYLQNVPRIATTHHETMKGTGYPRKLKGEELSIPERVLAVADIFEALTAGDRPYKKAKTISQSLNILHKMALDEHVDIEVFRLFIRTKIYLQYAERFLSEEQIDEVDESQYL